MNGSPHAKTYRLGAEQNQWESNENEERSLTATGSGSILAGMGGVRGTKGEEEQSCPRSRCAPGGPLRWPGSPSVYTPEHTGLTARPPIPSAA